MVRIIECEVCGKEVIKTGRNQRYCKKCSKVISKENQNKANKKKPFKKVCKRCGKEYYAHFLRQKFCSQLCGARTSAEKKRKQVKLICLICGREFERGQYRIKPGRKYFCSDKCRISYNERITIMCPCGNEFEVSKGRNKTAKYCSNKCRHKYRLRNKKYEFKKGQRTKDRLHALFVYGKKCELCGWCKLVEVHHIDENRDNHNIENLCVLCPNHHTLTETKYVKNKYYITKEELKEKLKNGRKRKK